MSRITLPAGPAVRVALAVAAACLVAPPAPAQFQMALTFNDPTSTYSSYYGRITTGVQAAGADWAGRVANTSGTMRVQVNFTGEATMSAGSISSHYVGTTGGIDTYEQGRWRGSPTATRRRGVPTTRC